MSSRALLGREHWNSRWFVLNGSELTYYKSEADVAQDKEPVGVLECRLAELHLTGGRDSVGGGGSGGSGGKKSSQHFYLTVRADGRQLQLRAATAQAYNLWHSRLSKVVKSTTSESGGALSTALAEGASASLKGEFELHGVRRWTTETLGLTFDLATLPSGKSGAPGGGARSMIAKAQTAAERDRWIKAINQYYATSRKQGGGGASAKPEGGGASAARRQALEKAAASGSTRAMARLRAESGAAEGAGGAATEEPLHRGRDQSGQL